MEARRSGDGGVFCVELLSRKLGSVGDVGRGVTLKMGKF